MGWEIRNFVIEGVACQEETASHSSITNFLSEKHIFWKFSQQEISKKKWLKVLLLFDGILRLKIWIIWWSAWFKTYLLWPKLVLKLMVNKFWTSFDEIRK